MKLLAAVSVAVALAAPGASAVGFLQSRQLAEGSFAERGRAGYPQLTAWAVLALRAAGARPGGNTARYLAQHEPELTNATDLALVSLASALPRPPPIDPGVDPTPVSQRSSVALKTRNPAVAGLP